jgi:hypothetical protein
MALAGEADDQIRSDQVVTNTPMHVKALLFTLEIYAGGVVSRFRRVRSGLSGG